MTNHLISIKVGRELVFVKANTIVFVKAENIYTTVHTINSPYMLASQTLSEMEKKLSDAGFFKPHRSYLINLAYIQKYCKSDLQIFLQGYDGVIPVSRNHRQHFEKLFIR